VNKLSRELSKLKAQQANGSGGEQGGETSSAPSYARSPVDPTTEAMLEALRRENETLRARMADYERDYVRLSRLNEVYREELIEHRSRVSYNRSFSVHKSNIYFVVAWAVGRQPCWPFFE